MEYLFVYGTLAPGKKNEHILADVVGEWFPAIVHGELIAEGWGAAYDCSGIVLDDSKSPVEGLIFASNDLSHHWTMLDAFEGDEYQRVLTQAITSDGDQLMANIYVLNK